MKSRRMISVGKFNNKFQITQITKKHELQKYSNRSQCSY